MSKVDCFRQFMTTVVDAARKELWEQQSKDWQQPGNKTNHSAVLKANWEISSLYSLQHQVRHEEISIYFNIDLDERLEQPLRSKQQWVNRWKQAILSSAQQAKRDDKNGTVQIYIHTCSSTTM